MKLSGVPIGQRFRFKGDWVIYRALYCWDTGKISFLNESRFSVGALPLMYDHDVELVDENELEIQPLHH